MVVSPRSGQHLRLNNKAISVVCVSMLCVCTVRILKWGNQHNSANYPLSSNRPHAFPACARASVLAALPALRMPSALSRSNQFNTIASQSAGQNEIHASPFSPFSPLRYEKQNNTKFSSHSQFIHTTTI